MVKTEYLYCGNYIETSGKKLANLAAENMLQTFKTPLPSLG